VASCLRSQSNSVSGRPALITQYRAAGRFSANQHFNERRAVWWDGNTKRNPFWSVASKVWPVMMVMPSITSILALDALVMQATGNLYAATSNEAGNNHGTVFEITP